MYAVFQNGSKQYCIIEGQSIYIERMNVEIGACVEFNQILIIKHNDCLQIGNPFIKNGKVIAKVIGQSLAKKIRIIKFRRRKHFRKCQGHRQHFTKIKVISINSML